MQPEIMKHILKDSASVLREVARFFVKKTTPALIEKAWLECVAKTLLFGTYSKHPD